MQDASQLQGGLLFSGGQPVTYGGLLNGVDTGALNYVSGPTPTAPTNNFNTGGSYTGGGGGSTAPAYDPAELTFLDSQIGSVNDRLGRFPNQLNTGINNLLQSYNRGIGQIESDRNSARSKYETTKTQTGQDYTNSRSGIRSDSGNLYNSLQRLLGAAGAGRSSASSVLAPFAVGKEAAKRFGQVQESFGRNQQNLDTQWNTTDRQLNDSRLGLDEDRRNKENSLRSGLAESEMGLRDRLMQLQLQRQSLTGGGAGSIQPILNESQNAIRGLLDRIDSLSANYANPSLNVARTAWKAPKLSAYNYSQFDAPTQNGQRDPRADYLSPFVNAIPEEEEQNV